MPSPHQQKPRITLLEWPAYLAEAPARWLLLALLLLISLLGMSQPLHPADAALADAMLGPRGLDSSSFAGPLGFSPLLWLQYSLLQLLGPSLLAYRLLPLFVVIASVFAIARVASRVVLHSSGYIAAVLLLGSPVLFVWPLFFSARIYTMFLGLTVVVLLFQRRYARQKARAGGQAKAKLGAGYIIGAAVLLWLTISHGTLLPLELAILPLLLALLFGFYLLLVPVLLANHSYAFAASPKWLPAGLRKHRSRLRSLLFMVLCAVQPAFLLLLFGLLLPFAERSIGLNGKKVLLQHAQRLMAGLLLLLTTAAMAYGFGPLGAWWLLPAGLAVLLYAAWRWGKPMEKLLLAPVAVTAGLALLLHLHVLPQLTQYNAPYTACRYLAQQGHEGMVQPAGIVQLEGGAPLTGHSIYLGRHVPTVSSLELLGSQLPSLTAEGPLWVYLSADDYAHLSQWPVEPSRMRAFQHIELASGAWASLGFLSPTTRPSLGTRTYLVQLPQNSPRVLPQPSGDPNQLSLAR